jgi:hypothetical protein
MLKRFLMIWLIISTLGYGSVWAFDGHIDTVAEHQDVVGDVDHAPTDNEDHPPCDHCCHASAHLMALWSDQFATAYPGSGTGYTPYLQSLSFNITSPPDRPPQG